MKYLMLIYGNLEKWASIPADEWPEAIAKQDAFNRKYQATGELIGAYGLADAVQAKLVRRENGQAHLHELAGDTDAAAAGYLAAARRATSRPERRYLALQAARLGKDH